MASIERKIKQLESDAMDALRVSCRDRRRVVADLTASYEKLRDDLHSIRDGQLARKLVGKSSHAVELLHKAERSLEQRCAGLGGTRKRRR